MEKEKKSKKKIIINTILILCATAILIYDTYQIHFSDRKLNNKSALSIEYENAGNILLSNVKNNDKLSLKIKVKNLTDDIVYYKIAFEDVVNELENLSSVTYTFSKEEGNVEIHSGTFPSENILLNEIDEIGAGEVLDYVLTIRVNTVEKIDSNKSIQARVDIIEVET